MLMFVTTMTVDTCGRIRVTDGVHLLCSILERGEERRTVRLARDFNLLQKLQQVCAPGLTGRMELTDSLE